MSTEVFLGVCFMVTSLIAVLSKQTNVKIDFYFASIVALLSTILIKLS